MPGESVSIPGELNMVNAKPTSITANTIASMGWKAMLVAGLAAVVGSGNAHAQACNDFATTDFKKTVLTTVGLESPVKMAITKDKRIFFTQRTGSVMLLKPGSTTPVKAASFVVANNKENEDGVLGIALDPKFESNNFIYIFHTLSSPMGYRVTRYTVSGDQMISEKTILTIPHHYTSYAPGQLVIHGAGAIAFDPAGNLLITTGDLMITAGGFDIPVNENARNFDAQATSANTNNMLGKLLRITPKDDGSYTIPAGNLFAPGTANTKPEIYAMGLRNPFTMTIDPLTGWAYVGEVGPDGTGGAIPSQDEVNQVKAATNLGWPYLTGDNQAYNNLTNPSKNNTGLSTLPAPSKSLFWFSNANSWPITGIKPNGSRCIKVGGFYRFDPSNPNAGRLPPAMDNGFFMANHEDDNATLRYFKLGADGALTAIKTVATGIARPMAFEVGPEGALYIVEWGSDNGHWFNGGNGKISRLDYTGTCSATGLIASSSKAKSGKASIAAVQPGSELVFPEGTNRVVAYDLNGTKSFSLAKIESRKTMTVPNIAKNGLMYLQFSKD
jgi:cytochrome c